MLSVNIFVNVCIIVLVIVIPCIIFINRNGMEQRIMAGIFQQYQLHPVLWNVKHNCYFLKNQKNELSNVIANNLNSDVEDVKKKGLSLLSSLSK